MEKKKRRTVGQLLDFAGAYRGHTVAGCALSAVAMAINMVPYVFVWLVVRSLITVAPNWTTATNIEQYGWWALAAAIAGIVVYFLALMCTHLAAFRTAANIRKRCMAHLAKAPLGYFDTRLFSASILDNVRAARPDATREQALAALHAAQCDDILNKLPEGVDTIIGSAGTYLSGGEQQRIALARAILKDAPIVVLDEATAFADPENEALIQAAFEQLLAGRTVVMIAHRLSTVVDADQIVVLDAGRVPERGTHTELVAANGLYARMWADYQRSVQWKIEREVA